MVAQIIHSLVHERARMVDSSVSICKPKREQKHTVSQSEKSCGLHAKWMRAQIIDSLAHERARLIFFARPRLDAREHAFFPPSGRKITISTVTLQHADETNNGLHGQFSFMNDDYWLQRKKFLSWKLEVLSWKTGFSYTSFLHYTNLSLSLQKKRRNVLIGYTWSGSWHEIADFVHGVENFPRAKYPHNSAISAPAQQIFQRVRFDDTYMLVTLTE